MARVAVAVAAAVVAATAAVVAAVAAALAGKQDVVWPLSKAGILA